jgi:6-phosphogluconolactonase (cycloisomerase 2 family)
MHWSQFSVAALLAGTAVAQKHRIFTSSITSPDLYTLEFDETTNRLVTLSNLTGNAAHPSISFSYDKASLYAAQKGGFSSYTVEQGQSLVYSKTISVAGQPGCANAADKTAKYINSLARVPFTVFGSLDGTCGVGIGVDYSGAFTNIDQSFQYSPSSLVGGMTFDPENRYLYSADEAANGIWVHSVSDMGRLTQLGFVTAPWQNAGPKRIAVHTDGRFLYVLFSKLNRIGVFAVNVGVAANQALITYTGVSYSTLPPSMCLLLS